MEVRVIGRGALAGFIAGVLGFVFARIFAEPLMSKAIAYESGRDDVLAALSAAAGRSAEPEGPEIFSRTVQSNIGMASGIIGFATAMGAICAVAYLLLHGRFTVRAQTLAWMVAAFGFFGIYLLPFVKYPANPPGIGHSFTVHTRGRLYLTMVVVSLVLLGLAVYATRKLLPRFGLYRSILIAALGFFVVYGVVIGLLPSLGHLAANKDHVGQLGFGRSATETPQPVVNILDKPLTIDGKTIQPGQIAYPGFDADLLWKFRWYSLLNQLIIWTCIGVVFGGLLSRYIDAGRRKQAPGHPMSQPAAVA